MRKLEIKAMLLLLVVGRSSGELKEPLLLLLQGLWGLIVWKLELNANIQTMLNGPSRLAQCHS